MNESIEAMLSLDRVKVSAVERDAGRLRRMLDDLRARLAHVEKRLAAVQTQTRASIAERQAQVHATALARSVASLDRYRELRARVETPILKAREKLLGQLAGVRRELDAKETQLRRAHGERLARERFSERLANEETQRRQSVLDDEQDDHNERRSHFPRR